MKNLARILVAMCIATVSLATSAQAQEEDAQWFVLRQETTGNCWAGLLIKVNGEYAHSFANIAGGPYKSKQEALDREKQLEQEGSCTAAS